MFNNIKPKIAAHGGGGLVDGINIAAGTLSHNDDDGVFSPRKIASPGAIASTEKQLGFTLRPLLRRIYTEVANGGFGPDSGIVGTGNRKS